MTKPGKPAAMQSADLQTTIAVKCEGLLLAVLCRSPLRRVQVKSDANGGQHDVIDWSEATQLGGQVRCNYAALPIAPNRPDC